MWIGTCNWYLVVSQRVKIKVIVYMFKFWKWSGPRFRPWALNKRLNIQRRLAWSLCKDDTHNRREATPFLPFLATPNNFYVCSNYYLLLLTREKRKLHLRFPGTTCCVVTRLRLHWFFSKSPERAPGVMMLGSLVPVSGVLVDAFRAHNSVETTGGEGWAGAKRRSGAIYHPR